jgi:3',5'-cyclic AMP phosphodiesterase CpdA
LAWLRAQGLLRLRRLCVRLTCVALALGLVIAVAVAVAASTVHRIVAVGDLHGDFSAWRDIARAAQLIDQRGHWIGRDTILVQTGDVVDRGPNSLEIIRDLMRLQREAVRTHGQVIVLVGNHEAMNLTGDLRYVSAGDYAAFADSRSAQRRENVYTANKALIEAAYRQRVPDMTSEAIKQAWIDATPLGALEHRVAWRPDGEIGRWIVSNPAIVLLDGNLFVHGGLSPSYSRLTIADMNHQVAAALTAQDTDVRSIINDPLGPLWYRGLATNGDRPGGPPAETTEPSACAPPVEPRSYRSPSTANANGSGVPSSGIPQAPAPDTGVEVPVKDQLETLLLAYGAKRIVIGHTPILSGIAMLDGGRLIRIDTGISAVYCGKVSYLDVVDGIPIPHVVKRSQPPPNQGAQ